MAVAVKFGKTRLIDNMLIHTKSGVFPCLEHMMKSKIHRATVTEANLNYVGSITIDERS